MTFATCHPTCRKQQGALESETSSAGSEWPLWAPAFYYQVLAHGFAQSLLLDDAGSVLAAATSWDELEIQEEAESGSSITSKIRLPTQVSQGPCQSQAETCSEERA